MEVLYFLQLGERRCSQDSATTVQQIEKVSYNFWKFNEMFTESLASTVPNLALETSSCFGAFESQASLLR